MREIAALRSKLREINIEYSRFLRKGVAEEKLARMGELRAERRGLMALIAQANAGREGRRLDVAPTQASRAARTGAGQAASEHLRQRPSLGDARAAR